MTQQGYTEYGETLPTYRDGKIDPETNLPERATNGEIRWFGKGRPPPKVGERVYVGFNKLGWGTVKGYFSELGYLGLLVQFENPPEWRTKKLNGNPVGHIFGAEWSYTK